MAIKAEQAAAELREILGEVAAVQSQIDSQYGGLRAPLVAQQLALLNSAISRLAPKGSSYEDESREVRGESITNRIARLRGVLSALQRDYERDRLSGFEATIRELVLGDLLEMADSIVADDTRFGKDAAASLAGPVLESHLRKLARASLPMGDIDEKGAAKGASALNDDLARTGRISRLEQKSVASWIALRNHAAHGQFDQYDQRQVQLMIEGIRAFIGRHPA